MEQFDKNNLQTATLEKYGTDLTKMAEEGKLDPVIGREQEIKCVIRILCKRRKNNPCLVGDPGVGKTMIAEGLAQHMKNATVPPNFSAIKVFLVDMGRLIAGTKYRGEFEERLVNLVDEVKKSNGAIIVFIDELHTLVGTAANILKPPLARGEIKCVGATTVQEYKLYIEKDPALARRFQCVEVPEPTISEAIQILKGLSHKYEKHHNIQYSDEALEAAVHLSKQYISERFLPDKAIDLMDESGSEARLPQTSETPSSAVPVVSENDVRQVVSSWTGIPIEKLSSKESIRLLEIQKTLNQSVIGQKEAIEAVSRVIHRARVGIRDLDRPIATFLFTGPTGVGKTEIAKVLATEYFGSKDRGMVRIDMSEYMEKHSVSRLIGSAPGYVGYREGGQLTEAIRRHPHQLVLFDEIEKAHRDVFNVFLQILDDGRLTDGQGRSVDFSNTIIIMTSNIGGGGKMQNQGGSPTSSQEKKIANKSKRTFMPKYLNRIISPKVGGGKKMQNQGGSISSSQEKEVANELKRTFTPEFLNRIDDVIIFKSLGEKEMREILDKMLKQVCERLFNTKKIEVKVTNEAKGEIMKEGYDCTYGARPMRRAITRLLEDGLAESILKGEVQDGDRVQVDVDPQGNITFLRKMKHK